MIVALDDVPERKSYLAWLPHIYKNNYIARKKMHDSGVHFSARSSGGKKCVRYPKLCAKMYVLYSKNWFDHCITLRSNADRALIWHALMRTLLYSFFCVQILVVASRMDQSDAFSLGCTCCLCHPRLVRGPAFPPRSPPARVLRCLGLARLPPAYLLLLAVLLGLIWLGVAVLWFSPLLATVGAILPEELFPSDHLMVVAKLKVQ